MLQLLYGENRILFIHKKKHLKSLPGSKIIFTRRTNEELTVTVVIGSDFVF